MEEWRKIAGYEGYFEVSNLGRVRSVERARWVKNRHGSRTFRKDKGRILALTDNGNGYLYISLNVNGARKNEYVHRLVATAFCSKGAGDEVVNHKDHDRKNNRAENLEWVTQMDNVRHSAHLMRGERGIGWSNTTGEKYIGIKKLRGETYFCVRKIKWIGNKDKCFRTMEEAVAYRDEVMKRAR